MNYPSDIAIGDIVRITRYMVGRLYTPMHDEATEGREAIVLAVREGNQPWGVRNGITVRLLESGGERSIRRNDEHEACELVRKGRGEVVPGFDYFFTDEEKKDQRWKAFLERLKTVDLRHQGFTNAATYLAHLYLANDQQAMHSLKFMRRKDGTVNTQKVQRLFWLRGLRVDDWALQCPIDVPEEFRGWPVPLNLHVSWGEVAASFAADKD